MILFLPPKTMPAGIGPDTLPFSVLGRGVDPPIGTAILNGQRSFGVAVRYDL